jgi:hypothetical protein
MGFLDKAEDADAVHKVQLRAKKAAGSAAADDQQN